MYTVNRMRPSRVKKYKWNHYSYYRHVRYDPLPKPDTSPINPTVKPIKHHLRHTMRSVNRNH